MARAQFHKNQRVYVRLVGTWAQIERVVPHWTKGLEEPIRIHYDVGGASSAELQAGFARLNDRRRRTMARRRARANGNPTPKPHRIPIGTSRRRPVRSKGGGWRVPSAEYALSPVRISGKRA
jgi:hypothetical protein